MGGVAVRSSSPDDELVAVLHHNEDLFSHMVGLAQVRVKAGRNRSAIEWCRVAASFAMTNGMGILRSNALEEVIDQVAAEALPTSPAVRQAPRGQLRVLHVLTEAAMIGGLSRLVERWIRRDADAISSVVITRQQGVLASLSAASEESGGRAMGLGSDVGDSLERAARLRGLALEADIVICHLHSDDPVAALAFGHGYRGAPVALYNHADHLFWLGPTGAAVVVDARDVGSLLTREARGYSTEATYSLPLLVPRWSPHAGREKIREALRVTPDQVVALTVARAVKYHDTALRPRFSEIAELALNDNPHVVLCVVGALESDPPWPTLLDRYPGRLRVTGPVSDPQAFFDAADLYLDTFPFSSSTSLLEACASSLPTLTLDAHRGFRRALGIADFVASEEDRPPDLDAYAAQLRLLTRDPALRRVRGRHARDTFMAYTSEESWLEELHDLYSKMQQAGHEGSTIGRAPAPAPDARLMDYGRAILAVEQRVPLLSTISGSLPRFDAADRRWLSLRRMPTRLARKVSKLLGADPSRTDALLLPGWQGRAARASKGSPG